MGGDMQQTVSYPVVELAITAWGHASYAVRLLWFLNTTLYLNVLGGKKYVIKSHQFHGIYETHLTAVTSSFNTQGVKGWEII